MTHPNLLNEFTVKTDDPLWIQLHEKRLLEGLDEKDEPQQKKLKVDDGPLLNITTVFEPASLTDVNVIVSLVDDLGLATGQKMNFQCHKQVLATQCKYFETMFTQDSKVSEVEMPTTFNYFTYSYTNVCGEVKKVVINASSDAIVFFFGFVQRWVTTPPRQPYLLLSLLTMSHYTDTQRCVTAVENAFKNDMKAYSIMQDIIHERLPTLFVCLFIASTVHSKRLRLHFASKISYFSKCIKRSLRHMHFKDKEDVELIGVVISSINGDGKVSKTLGTKKHSYNCICKKPVNEHPPMWLGLPIPIITGVPARKITDHSDSDSDDDQDGDY